MGRSSHTKYSLHNLPPSVVVTRRHHPLWGQELDVIQANKVALTIRMADGSTMRMLRAWTNAGEAATALAEPSDCCVFTIEAVREFLHLVRTLRHRE
jgi:hypothetical protein